MTFTPEQNKALGDKLDPRHVASRQQSGRSLSYIEGWHAIAEANRIFGFDAWNRETVDVRCVSERERKIGRDNKPGWGVSYTARVRVTVGDVVREGVGAGHGIDADCGSAHESAIKEAETDAMKRALMTFGNPFGLALYDKTQANVGTSVDAQADKHADDLAKSMLDFINTITTSERLEKWISDQEAKGEDGRNAFDYLSDDGWAKVERAFKAKRYGFAKAAA